VSNDKKTACCGSAKQEKASSCCSATKEEKPNSGCCGKSDVEQPVKASCCSAVEAEPVTEQDKAGASTCCAGKAKADSAKKETPVSSCCAPQPETTSGCCGSGQTTESDGCCGSDSSSRIDWILWGCGSAVVLAYLGYWLSNGAQGIALPWLSTILHTAHEMVHAMWWGILSAAFFVGILGRIPRELVMSVLGKAGTKRGVFRATLAGLMLDLCNHGILMVGMKLYERGASAGQVMAFLIASPWNSLTLTLILVGLIGLKWTLLFIVASLVIAWISGLIFDRLVAAGTLPANPNHTDVDDVDFWPTLKSVWAKEDWSLPALLAMFWQGLKESKMVLRWVFFGVVLVALIRAFVPEDSFGVWFGATFGGLVMTLLATTVIEVCSEGSSPIAADLFNRAAAPGNAFTFLMAGAATDYTEIMSLKETTKSWKIALFLPLITVPQVLLIGWLMNLAGV